ncbi:hypothetical protein ABZ215_24875 [Amycolatopsis sp. NPDC006131]
MRCGSSWVHPAATAGLLEFLDSRGLKLARFPNDADDLPTFALTPKEV